MRRVFLPPWIGVLCLTIGLLAACGDRPTPTQPTATTTTTTTAPPSSGPPAPPGPTLQLTNLLVNGPASVPPGTTASYTATARWSDGSTRDVTSEAVWSSTDGSVLSVTGLGTVAGQTSGDATLEAAFSGATGGRPVYVVPEGRFIIWVRVTDGEIGVVAPIFDAKVEVPGTGISSTTDWNGSAKLIGVPADIEIRVIKDGFHSVVRPAQITRNGFSIGVQLFPTGPRISLTGEYRLVVSSRVCEAGGSLPESVKTRTYSAGIHEPGGKVRVLLRDGPFVIKPPASASRWGGDGNAFDGQTQVVDTLFTLIEYVPGSEDGYGIHPSVAERLPDGTVLTFSGRAVVRPAPEGFLGTLDGAIAIYNVIDSEAGTGRLLASCRSRAHGFNLLR